jgi:hypothetical protein
LLPTIAATRNAAVGLLAMAVYRNLFFQIEVYWNAEPIHEDYILA